MSYHIIPAELREHREDILRLWNANMRERWSKATLERRFTWFYKENPLGPPLTRLVVHTETGDIIGTASAIPRMFLLDGKPLRAGLLSDFMIDRGHRLAGPALMVQRAIASESKDAGFSFLYGYPNEGAKALFPRLRFKKLHESSWWTRPVRTRTKLATYLHPVMAAVGGVLLDRVIAANDLRLQLSRLSRLRARKLCQAGPRIDELWDRASSRGDLVPVRSADYLRWRYLDNPMQSAQMFCVERPGGDIAGYVVFELDSGVVNVLDVFVDGDQRLLEATVLRFVRFARSLPVRSVCVGYAGAGNVSEALKNLQFIEHLEHRNVIAWVDKKKQPKELREAIYQPDRWRMFDGELDV